MKVAVFGASGFIGQRLCDFLKKMNIEVVEYSSKNPFWLNTSEGGLRDDFVFEPNIDCVVYLCQSPYYRQASEHVKDLYKINTVMAFQLASIASKQGIGKFFYTSTGNVYCDHFSPVNEDYNLRDDSVYALSKIHGEKLLLSIHSQMEVTVFRLFGVFGPNQKKMLIYNIAEKILNNEQIIIERNISDPSDVDGLKVSYIFVDDFVEILFKAFSKKLLPKIINIGGPQALSLKPICQKLEIILNRKANLVLSEKMRKTDFCADITLLESVLNPNFHDFTKSLELTFLNDEKIGALNVN
ncbi:NAD(P)-dependent oxidoreductase [bacterium]|nr:NAD(P)-dependent oxidoreductase [bacterium]